MSAHTQERSLGTEQILGCTGSLPLAALVQCAVPLVLAREDGMPIFRNTAANELWARVADSVQWRNCCGGDLDQCSFTRERVQHLRRLARERAGAVFRDALAGEQMITHAMYIAPGAGEELARFLLLLQRTHGQCRASDYPGKQFVECSAQLLGPLETLSAREIEVLALIGEGLTAAQIAARIFRSEETVNSHKASILRKLSCHNAAQLALVANRAGLKYEDGQLFAGQRTRE